MVVLFLAGIFFGRGASETGTWLGWDVSRTDNRSMDSSFCRGTIVTSSISQRKATSEGSSPGGREWAMASACAMPPPMGMEGWWWLRVTRKEVVAAPP